MTLDSCETARQLALSLSREDQLRLIQELTANLEMTGTARSKASVLELGGLGKEIWEGIDAQEYVNRERDSWDH